ncbi:autotransporter outer membrane beta-barrel domain-containing protein [Pragia fontium]|uniref:Autotransporter family porin n=1 Tax=Pragia fontium DSM 5563 = ATCC 49100 TaxID=1122977 RepID=A0AAJ4WCW8_9GAMM|nr:autotransporter outer membrane beta-barrel domain-containing protein [Pragia fontium]SFD29248.1 autotransporter family porin [Pragia fontium DSM 5563 = ATCC 49100]VEJ56831.1 Outer membrane protein IcsA autotransporter precursor [Pragia fontium]
MNNKSSAAGFKKRYLISLMSAVLFSTSSSSLFAAQLIADSVHGSQIGIDGGEFINAGTGLTDAAVIASGIGYEIDASNLNIKVPDALATAADAGVYVEQGGKITLTDSDISNARIIAADEGSKLILNGVTLSTPEAGNAITVRDKAEVEFNNVTISGDHYLSLLASNNTKLTIDNLNSSAGIYLTSGSSGTLKNSDIKAISNIGVAVTLSGSDLRIDNSKLFGRGGGMVITNQGSAKFYGGILRAETGALSINQNSTFEGDNVEIISDSRRAVQITQGSSLTLSGNSKISGLDGIYADSAKLDLSDLAITTTGSNLGHGIWLQNLDRSCITGCDTMQLKRSTIDTVGTSSNGVYLTVGAKADIDNTVITTLGNSSMGVYVSGSSSSYSPSSLKLTNSQINTSGESARGVYLRNYTDAGQVTGTLDSVKITTGGLYSAALALAEGVSVMGSNVTLESNGEYTTALEVIAGTAGKSNSLTLNGGKITSNKGAAISTAGFSTINLSHMDISGLTGVIVAGASANTDMTMNQVNATGDITAAQGSQVNLQLNNASVLKGSITGTNLLIDSSSQWQITDDSAVNRLENSGTVKFDPQGMPGRVLTVNGDYVGNNGVLILNTELNDDSSATDKLLVTGNTSGQSYLQINNAGGLGGETVNGIEVINVGGQSNGSFTLNSRVSYGGYEYFLYQGDSAGNGGDWYLRSEYVTTPVPPPGPDPDPDPLLPTPPPLPQTKPVIEPEVGAYVGNQVVANTLFNLRLHDRLGEPQFTAHAQGDRSLASSMWLRVVSSQERNRVADNRLKVQTNATLVQLGGDIAQWNLTGQDRLHLGVMAGYGNAHLTSRSMQSEYSAKSQIDGYNLGAYATWYANQDLQQNGLYVDSWLQHNWFDNDVTGDQRSTIHYKSKGFSASLETGYTQKIIDYAHGSWFVQPQAQVIWSGVHADNVNDGRGSTIDSGNQDYWQTRVGLRTYLQGKSPVNQQQTFQPFIEVNWLHNGNDYGVDYRIASGTRHYESDTAKDIGEAKIGIEGKLTNSFSVWGNVAHQFDGQDYSYTAGTLGVKYQF